MSHVLIVRADGMGDVLLAGPSIRAVAAGAGRVTMLCSPSGAAAASRLPGVDAVLIERLPWIDADPQAVDPRKFARSVERLRAANIQDAVILTSFHQSALPTALMLRLAGVSRIGAISTDYPGALLDVRHHVAPTLHEVERALSLVTAMGYDAPDDDRLQVSIATDPSSTGAAAPYVVVHPGASVPARTLAPRAWRDAAAALVASGRRVLVTGSTGEHDLVHAVVPAPSARICPYVCESFDQLAEVIASADALVVGNTGPAHLAAALGTPVVSCFAPTVSATNWHPWRVEHVLLGAQGIACAGCRARQCPHQSQHCLEVVTPGDIVAAVDALTAAAGNATGKERISMSRGAPAAVEVGAPA